MGEIQYWKVRGTDIEINKEVFLKRPKWARYAAKDCGVDGGQWRWWQTKPRPVYSRNCWYPRRTTNTAFIKMVWNDIRVLAEDEYEWFECFFAVADVVDPMKDLLQQVYAPEVENQVSEVSLLDHVAHMRDTGEVSPELEAAILPRDTVPFKTMTGRVRISKANLEEAEKKSLLEYCEQEREDLAKSAIAHAKAQAYSENSQTMRKRK